MQFDVVGYVGFQFDVRAQGNIEIQAVNEQTDSDRPTNADIDGQTYKHTDCASQIQARLPIIKEMNWIF